MSTPPVAGWLRLREQRRAHARRVSGTSRLEASSSPPRQPPPPRPQLGAAGVASGVAPRKAGRFAVLVGSAGHRVGGSGRGTWLCTDPLELHCSPRPSASPAVRARSGPGGRGTSVLRALSGPCPVLPVEWAVVPRPPPGRASSPLALP